MWIYLVSMVSRMHHPRCLTYIHVWVKWRSQKIIWFQQLFISIYTTDSLHSYAVLSSQSMYWDFLDDLFQIQKLTSCIDYQISEDNLVSAIIHYSTTLSGHHSSANSVVHLFQLNKFIRIFLHVIFQIRKLISCINYRYQISEDNPVSAIIHYYNPITNQQTL